MSDATLAVSSAQTTTTNLITTIEARPKINDQASLMISTLNSLLQQLSDLSAERTRIGTASELRTSLQPLFISPLETFMSANLTMQKLGQLNTSKTVPTQQLAKENVLAKALVENLRQILSSLGGQPFIPNNLPPGPIVPYG